MPIYYKNDLIAGAEGGSGGTSLTAGDGITIQDDTIRVTTPVKGVTQAEYDALSEEEKSKGLYIVTDANINFNDRGDIYSTEETRIGAWIDGKPLYRRVIRCKTPTTAGGPKTVFLLSNGEYVTKLSGFFIEIVNNVEKHFTINGPTFGSSGPVGVSMQQVGDHVEGWASQASFANKDAFVMIEYTKAVDTGVSV